MGGRKRGDVCHGFTPSFLKAYISEAKIDNSSWSVLDSGTLLMDRFIQRHMPSQWSFVG